MALAAAFAVRSGCQLIRFSTGDGRSRHELTGAGRSTAWAVAGDQAQSLFAAVSRSLAGDNRTDMHVLDGTSSAADLYLMPATTTVNTFEGYEIVFIEANAHGIPCIGTETSGAAEAIREGETGYHADPSDADQIAERMAWVLDERRIGSEDADPRLAPWAIF